jgi:hypothetical protein
MSTRQRILADEAAAALIQSLQQQHGPLMFHLSGGCCDGSSPMCFADGEFRVGQSDVCLGLVEGCRFFMSKDQFEYWRHCQLILTVTPGRGSSFSLEIPTGKRFMLQSVLLDDALLTPLLPFDEPTI